MVTLRTSLIVKQGGDQDKPAMTKLFSSKNRPPHLGPYPMENLKRGPMPDLTTTPISDALTFQRPDAPLNIVNAMTEYQTMLDVIRNGIVAVSKSGCPDDPGERARHLKSFGYFCDASFMGVTLLPDEARLTTAHRNPDIDRLADDLKHKQTNTLSSGIDAIMAGLKETVEAPETGIANHTHALVIAYEYPRDPRNGERGVEWLENAQAHRACLRASETAIVLAQYLRLFGYQARAHTGSTSDVALARLAVSAGIATCEDGTVCNPFVGSRFGLAAVTTDFELEADMALAPLGEQSLGLAWKVGAGGTLTARNRDPYEKRDFVDGPHAFESLKRVDKPTTFIDEDRVPRVPKRTDMFARSLFGDLGKNVQEGAKGGHYAIKAAPSAAQRRALGAFTLLQDGPSATPKAAQSNDSSRNTENLKATAYWLGADAVGASRCPDWTWYSHDAAGVPIEPPHDQALSIIIDQGFETMEGASGDDWISCAQSMRAYLRFSLIGGVLAKQIRNMGYKAKAHTVIDGTVLQPPLLLLAGLGEVSRIGEVILNPFLGPRLKSGVVTTDMPLAHDKPIDFGLQKFCESCNKCARECPSGAITAGPKLMFNGYEIWKSDSQKCTTYRITVPGGAMCGRCMKTCPWNLEGLFAEAPFRWAAMNMPRAAPLLAKLDDAVGRGGLNPAKKWWWDLELQSDGSYQPSKNQTNERDLQKDLDLKYEDQTLAVYPANLTPPPWPYPYAMDREAGIEAYQAMITAEEYQSRLETGATKGLAHAITDHGEAPVIQVVVAKAEQMTDAISKYEFRRPDGADLPVWQAGAHIDIVVAPEYVRQYSMSGDPSDRSKYQVGVLREDEGTGGSKLLHRIFNEGRKIFISKPINHFALEPLATKTFLMGGGIGITPMMAMAHELYREGRAFEMHYSFSSRASAGYLDDIETVPWSTHVQLHSSDAGTRADLQGILGRYQDGHHVYTCGPDRYMSAVLEAAEAGGFPEEARHLEYFSVPDVPDYVDHPFKLKLARSGRELEVGADDSAAAALQKAGYKIDIKCSDGICGVCKCDVISGEIEHRDFVLSKAQRAKSFISCQSRAAEPGGTIEIDL